VEITCRVYKPRRPRESPLFRLVDQHLEELLRVGPERFARTHGPLRPVVERVMREFLTCGLAERGFARAGCSTSSRSRRSSTTSASAHPRSSGRHHSCDTSPSITRDERSTPWWPRERTLPNQHSRLRGASPQAVVGRRVRGRHPPRESHPDPGSVEKPDITPAPGRLALRRPQTRQKPSGPRPRVRKYLQVHLGHRRRRETRTQGRLR
jgi:hypothetical protein